MSEPEERDEPPLESPPEGAVCSEHPERPAVVICPRCGSYTCLTCWHSALTRCHACVARSPGPNVPWEEPTQNIVARFANTLLDAFSPLVTAPTFRHDGVARAVVFFLLTFAPLAAVSGIVPFTAHVVFRGAFTVDVRVHGAALWLDVARACALGLAFSLAQWAALTIPFVSLSRAFADRGHPDAPIRALLYRGWLIPLFAVVDSVIVSYLAERTLFAQLVICIPLVLLLSTMRATARMGSGAGPFSALVVIAVPFAVMLGASMYAQNAVLAVVPELRALQEELREAQESAPPAPPPRPSYPPGGA